MRRQRGSAGGALAPVQSSHPRPTSAISQWWRWMAPVRHRCDKIGSLRTNRGEPSDEGDWHDRPGYRQERVPGAWGRSRRRGGGQSRCGGRKCWRGLPSYRPAWWGDGGVCHRPLLGARAAAARASGAVDRGLCQGLCGATRTTRGTRQRSARRSAVQQGALSRSRALSRKRWPVSIGCAIC